MRKRCPVAVRAGLADDGVFELVLDLIGRADRERKIPRLETAPTDCPP